MVIKITKWRATDGSEWYCEEDALHRENEIELKIRWGNQRLPTEFLNFIYTHKDLISKCIKNSDKL